MNKWHVRQNRVACKAYRQWHPSHSNPNILSDCKATDLLPDEHRNYDHSSRMLLYTPCGCSIAPVSEVTGYHPLLSAPSRGNRLFLHQTRCLLSRFRFRPFCRQRCTSVRSGYIFSYVNCKYRKLPWQKRKVLCSTSRNPSPASRGY